MQIVIRAFLVIGMVFSMLVPALSEGAWEVLFDKEYHADLASGTRLVYEQTNGVETNDTSSLQILMLKGQKAELTVVSNQHERKVGNFSSEVGNPIVLYFLEEVVRSMSRQTKGSPFYIRNRITEAIKGLAIKEAVASESTGNGMELRILPFATDKNKIKMANFGELSIVATVSEDVPGGIVSLEALTPVQDGDQDHFKYSIIYKKLVGE